MALTQLRNRLYVRAGSPEDDRLKGAMEELLEDADGGVSVKGVPISQAGVSVVEAGTITGYTGRM